MITDNDRGNPNKYKGECHHCHNTVPAGMGYWNGATTCADLVEVLDGYGKEFLTCKNNENVIINWFASKSYIAQREADKAQREAAKAISDKRNAEWVKEKKDRVVKNKKLKSDGKCTRCGGAGSSDNWIATGSVCFKCNGTGKAQ